MIPHFLKEERAKVIVILVVGRPKLLPLGDAESEVLELAFPFAETSLQQDATFPVQLAAIAGKIAQVRKERHLCALGVQQLGLGGDHVRAIAPQPACELMALFRIGLAWPGLD